MKVLPAHDLSHRKGPLFPLASEVSQHDIPGFHGFTVVLLLFCPTTVEKVSPTSALLSSLPRLDPYPGQSC